MVENQNASIVDGMSENLKESNLGLLPKNVSNSIQPVLVVNPVPFANEIKAVSSASTGSHTFYTTPTDKDFYLTACWMSYKCDALADSTIYKLRIYAVGKTSVTNLLILNKPTLTLSSGNISLTLPIPLLLARGSVVDVSQAFGAGSSTINGGIMGYIVETLKK